MFVSTSEDGAYNLILESAYRISFTETNPAALTGSAGRVRAGCVPELHAVRGQLCRCPLGIGMSSDELFFQPDCRRYVFSLFVRYAVNKDGHNGDTPDGAKVQRSLTTTPTFKKR